MMSGHTRFDEEWLDLISKLMDSGGELKDVTINLPSVLDGCPTLPLPNTAVVESMTSAIRGLINMDEVANPNAESVTIRMPDAELRISITGVELLFGTVEARVDLPCAVLWASQVALTRMAFTHARPGPMTIHTNVLRLLPENQKNAMGLLVDWPKAKLGDLVRRCRNTRFTGGWLIPRDVREEYDLLLSISKLMTYRYQVTSPYQPILQNSLASDVLALVWAGAERPVVDKIHDEAIARLVAREVVVEPLYSKK
jgi:hypothetical protein